ncbi:MAG: histidine kinase [Desulfuromonadaceae bacterium]|nr:histidine kinase [Desulfuromonadaceae bacterium]MDD5106897.1 histidine kinase [Desulfuromonadaceae bacterium]
MNSSFAIKIGLLFSSVLLSLILFFSHSFFTHYSNQDKEENRVFSLIVTLDELLKSIRDVRTAQREYIHSNEARYLDAYRAAVHRVDLKLVTLQAMTRHRTKYQEKLAEISLLIQQRQKTLDEDIENGMSNNPIRGQLINEIMENVSDLKRQTIHDLQESSANQQQNLKIIWYLLMANGFIVIILFITIFLLLRREIARRTQEGLELSRNRDLLDMLVAQRTEELLTANQNLKNEMHIRKATEDSLHKLNCHMETIREEERVAISRDIHDEIGQSLTALKLDLAWMEHKFLPGNSEFIERLDMMRSTLSRLIGKAQVIITNLRPPLLDNLGLAEAMGWQVSEFRRRSGIECHLNMDKNIEVLDEKVATAVIRIAIEALTNISRHAEATTVLISLSNVAETLILEIIDNGCGISSQTIISPTSYGLMGMQERARLCLGTLSIKGVPGTGTTVRLSIPAKSLQEQL